MPPKEKLEFLKRDVTAKLRPFGGHLPAYRPSDVASRGRI